MPRTIVCQSCGIPLNLPSEIEPGKRLKCPKCSHRFSLSDLDQRSASTAPGLADAAQTSLGGVPTNLPPLPDSPPPQPRAEGHLRETFDLPSLGAADDPGLMPDLAPTNDKQVGDAAALFDHATAPRKRKSTAELRSQARRCTSCQGFVPAGMSICQVCGLDQETGIRIDLDDDLGPKGPPPIIGPPLHVAIVGGICGLASVIMALIALVVSVRQESDPLKYGWICLAGVAAFGAYASYEFLRGRSVKLLMLALTLGVFVDLVGMIALPLFNANTRGTQQELVEKPTDAEASADDNIEDVQLKSTLDLIDPDFYKIKLGFFLVAVYVGMQLYLMSPPVRRYMNRRKVEITPIPLG